MDKLQSASGRKPDALFLSAEAPYPAIGGGPLRSASVLEYLARHYAVHAIVFRQSGEPHPALVIPAGLLARLDVIDLPHHSKHAVARVLRNGLRVLTNQPPLVDRFSGFGLELRALLGKERYETAVIEHFWCAPYLEQVRPHSRSVVLNLHNIESVWHQRVAAQESGVRAMALHRFAAASAALERRWLPEFDYILTTSGHDLERVRGLVQDGKAIVYPNALPDLAAPARADRQEIVFSGNLEYAPNISAIQFFHRQVWPLLAARWPALKWRIIGRNPEAVRTLLAGDCRVELTGFVEDAIAALAESQVAVIPLLAGSGTRVKILEAWAAATPVVSTTIGAEGLAGCDQTHLVLADEPDQFAGAVSNLLASPADRMRIGSAGRRLFEQQYTWPAAWKMLAPVFGNDGRSGAVY